MTRNVQLALRIIGGTVFFFGFLLATLTNYYSTNTSQALQNQQALSSVPSFPSASDAPFPAPNSQPATQEPAFPAPPQVQPEPRRLREPIAVQDAANYSFGLLGCERKGTTTTCYLTAKNNGLKTNSLNICPSHMIDNLGNSSSVPNAGDGSVNLTFNPVNRGECATSIESGITRSFMFQTTAFTDEPESVSIVFRSCCTWEFTGDVIFRDIPLLRQ